jgi:hypothetical protein
LKPGGHLLAFGGTRTYHRMTVAIEDAGFEIRDSIHWIYGSGFAKSLNVSKEIDKRGLGSGDVTAFKAALSQAVAESGKSRQQINSECGFTMRFDVPFDKDPSGWGCSLPSMEQYEIIGRVLGDGLLARWPRERMARMYQVIGVQQRMNAPTGIVSTGQAAVPVRREITAPGSANAARWEGWGTALKPGHEPIVLARRPLSGNVAANVLDHGTGALNIDACRTAAGQDYHDKCASVVGLASNRNGDAYGEWTGVRENSAHEGGRWPTNVLVGHNSDCGSTCTRGCPVTTLGAEARYFPVFRYEAKAPASERPRLPDGTTHATVKPLALMRWLIRLVTPPEGLVLDPFAGSGTTLEAATVEGFRVTGIERDPAHAELCRTRLAKPIEPVLFGEAS